jgi:hypothetical protein
LNIALRNPGPNSGRVCLSAIGSAPTMSLTAVTQKLLGRAKETWSVSFRIEKKQKKIDLTAFVALVSRHAASSRAKVR